MVSDDLKEVCETFVQTVKIQSKVIKFLTVALIVCTLIFAIRDLIMFILL